ncbi:N-formylglutamate deformylase [Asaia sp. VD9]|uniref:N-formylglutamate deformylase n=1 Tax=Asaia sp. VD9 TaxID=3081235 RepID=UPI0030178923
MTETAFFTLTRGELPVLIALPHTGLALAPGQEARMTATGQARPDTDWHMTQLYDFAPELGIGVLAATHSRYVIDLNRGPDDATLYPGRPKTGLVPEASFDGAPLYHEGMGPDTTEIAARRALFWQPYHDALAAELARLKALWGWAVLWDGHSIRGRVPRLFEGKLPDLNLGTNDGASCAPKLRNLVAQELESQSLFSHVIDGRFKGGYTTRHYGQPHDNIHALQMEMAQSTYLEREEAPWTISSAGTKRSQSVLVPVLRQVASWRP